MRSEQKTYEINAWLRTLDYLQQENIQMKNLVAAVVGLNNSAIVLEKVEHYQSSFLNKDTVIAFLRKDISELQQNGLPAAEIAERHKTLRLDMEKMEKEFSMLKTDFNHYIFNVID